MDIDLVYLWVDGNDPVWLTKKNEFLPADRQVDPQVAGECRYVENDELRYSLRSVEKFAPWIRRVYIVTDDQTPAWLDTSNPRIRVVSHREIMPADKIDEIIDKYLNHITDVKPITARQCIKLLPIIAKYKPELRNDIISALHKANICVYDDSMQPLVYKDIQKALKKIQKL